MSLVVTVLTGRRPNLLERTLKALEAHQGAVLESAYVVAMNNGGDGETAEVLRRYGYLFNKTIVTSTLLGIGEAVTVLFGVALERGDYLLHVEDDWEASPGEWWDQAKALLEDGIFQVRLRRADEKVLIQHMVTKQRLEWEDGDDYKYTRDAHYTLNPSLVRTVNLAKGWPASGEREAQQKLWHAKKRKVAQLIPGIFTHIGETESLRRGHVGAS